MSKNRENVIWDDEDGRWCMGFFTVIEPPIEDQDEDYDDEWDVDYDYSTFEFATVGHLTMEAAWNDATADRANPGSSTICRRIDKPEQCAQFDQMAAECIQIEVDRQARIERRRAAYNTTAR